MATATICQLPVVAVAYAAPAQAQASPLSGLPGTYPARGPGSRDGAALSGAAPC